MVDGYDPSLPPYLSNNGGVYIEVQDMDWEYPINGGFGSGTG